MSADYKNWQYFKDRNHIVWLSLDKENSSVNVIDENVLSELESIIESMKQENVNGLAIMSAKETGFAAGADIKMFTTLKDQKATLDSLNRCHNLFDEIENLDYPTICLIDGFALGGGLELALTCDYILLSDNPKTQIGFPEVKLGLHPGWGGTFRSLKKAGPLQALPLMLTGKSISSHKAYKIGLADKVVPQRHFKRAALDFINTAPPKKCAGILASLCNAGVIRPFIANKIRQKTAEKVKEAHYPAPFRIIENWLAVADEMPKAQEKEISSFVDLAASDTSQNLINVFFLQDKLKSLGKKSEFNAHHIHVIGAGIMGGDIAIWCVMHGLTVSIQDQQVNSLTSLYQRAMKIMGKKLKDRRKIAQAFDRLIPDPHGDGIKKASIIIEAIYENREAKQRVFQQVEKLAPKDAILATNTSSIPLDEIAKSLKQPSRLIGIHFFNPVARMPLVEVVKTQKTDPNIIEQAIAFVRQIKKLPLPVTSEPGFLVNRILMPYLMEAIVMLEEGVSAQHIDAAATDFGMPMGPIELSDTVGLDICLAVGETLAKAFNKEVPKLLIEKVEKGELGRKSQKGFYNYDKGNIVHKPIEKNPQQETIISERLILAMYEEAKQCLKEGIVEDEELLDAGMIFGTGFAPFRGGLMHYHKHKQEL